jgi:hypothetical protein
MASGEWWNIWTLASAQAEEITPHTIQSATKPQQGGHDQWGEIYTVAGPYATETDAKNALSGGTGPPKGSTGPSDSPLSGWNLQVTGIAAWFVRGLKVVFGGILIILGISHLTGADNKITELAGSAVKSGAIFA